MGRIKKVAGPKHEATLPPILSDFVAAAIKLLPHDLPAHLKTFPSKWPFPRGDLYHWIPLLDLFDGILETFINEYGLKDGPQLQPFGLRLLSKGVSGTDGKIESENQYLEELASRGFGPEGDRELIESILGFSRMLLETCGNRSLYSSSDRLGDLLNTTSLSLLSTTLRLASRLAIRYHYSRARNGVNQHMNTALLASHYNINLEHVQKLSQNFIKPTNITNGASFGLSSTSASNGKEKVASGQSAERVSVSSSDSLYLVNQGVSESASQTFEDADGVTFVYYPSSSPASEDEKREPAIPQPGATTSASTTTSTPTRRASGLSRSSRPPTMDESPSPSVPTSTSKAQDSPSNNEPRTITISSSTIATTPIEEILESKLTEIPKPSHYDFLNRLRLAKAIGQGEESRRQAVAIRLLAITNLAYVYPEPLFQQVVLQHDSDEPRRLQIVYQLAELVHPKHATADFPLQLQSIALGTLEALSKHKARSIDVCTALQVNVGHGTIFQILHAAVAELAVEGSEIDTLEDDDWREALFSLLDSLPSAGSRTAESLIGAGLFDILVKVLELRTQKAGRIHHKILIFMTTITHSVRDSLQTFANCRGLDVIADLIRWEVSASIQQVDAGQGLSEYYRSQVMDYQMPFFQQQTLRWLFKLVNHLMQHGNANHDRLLRNLIDSPPLLSGLRDVIARGKVFGSNIWSGAASIMSSFIHNEPTSYAIIAEAGLSKALFEAVSLKPVTSSPTQSLPPNIEDQTSLVAKTDTPDVVTVTTRPSLRSQPEKVESMKISRDEQEQLAQGILPATDAIVTIPQAFGAICLNTSGLELFLQSGALDTFFEVFESPDHVKSLGSERDLPKLLGNAFDELTRHHPKLKPAILRAVTIMLARVACLCDKRAEDQGEGAKLWPVIPRSVTASPEDHDSLPIHGATTQSQSAHLDEDTTMQDLLPAESKRTPRHDLPKVTDYVGLVARFLAGFCENQALCGALIQEGGLEFLMDIATLPSLPPDFNEHRESLELAKVLHTFAEYKPHLVLPSLINRTKEALETLEPLLSHSDKRPFFVDFLLPLDADIQEGSLTPVDGSGVVKALVQIHTLGNILQETFSHSAYSPRTSHTLFSQFNLTDQYIDLVKDLGRLHRACIWEEVSLHALIPDSLKKTLKTKSFRWGDEDYHDVDDFFSRILNHRNRNRSANHSSEDAAEPERQTEHTSADAPLAADPEDPTITSAGKKAKNAGTLMFLLSSVPSPITPFLRGLGGALIPKRRWDAYIRQNAYRVADAIAEAAMAQLSYEQLTNGASTKDRFAYLIVVLTSISQMMIEGSTDRPHSQCLTLILQAFKKRGGLDMLNKILDDFFQVTQSENDSDITTGALGGMKIILSLYAQISTAKYIVECTQTQLMVGSGRDRGDPYYFSAYQFLVEVRASVLSVVRPIWNSSIVEMPGSSIVKCLIDILRSILEADQEHGAFKKGENIPSRAKAQFEVFSVSGNKEASLQARFVPPDLAREALYRCLNNREAADEYCDAHINQPSLPRLSIPPYDQEKKKSPAPSPSPARESQESQETIPDAENASQGGATASSTESSAVRVTLASADAGDLGAQVAASQARLDELRNTLIQRQGSGASSAQSDPSHRSGADATGEADEGENAAMSIDNSDNLEPRARHLESNVEIHDSATPVSPLDLLRLPESANPDKMVRVEELNEARDDIRDNLIDHVIDMLSAHDNLTFDLSDLVITAASKASDPDAMRRNIGETLVQSLLSFQGEEDFSKVGLKIASNANLLAILLQQKDFYDCALEELKGNFSQLLGFIKIFPQSAGEDQSPWIGQILLVLEKLLAEEAQPQQIRWTPPSADWDDPEDSMAEMDVASIPLEDKAQLFEAIMEILPKIGRDSSLALSVVRVLVILTRNREIADMLADKRSLQRLFVMVKQLAGIADEKFHKAFMLILRHIIEDDEMIKETMRKEIVSFFKPTRSRPQDTTSYTRHMAHLVIRSPSLFLEVTNEKLKLQSFNPNERPQTIVLKADKEEASSRSETSNALKHSNPTDVLTKEGDLQETVRPSTEEAIHSSTQDEKSKAPDLKVPVLERPDGVTHYLLSQLLSYKEVEDKDTDGAPKENVKNGQSMTDSDTDEIADSSPMSSRSATPVPGDQDRKAEKVEYKAEQHPIYNYRCFLLQCLTELLMSYASAKVEFINFSQRVTSKTMTPWKPRSTILNYLLSILIPLTTLDRPESISSKKKQSLSNWAMCVIVALCLKPNQHQTHGGEDAEEEPDSDLLFIRKFVLEHALKTFKETQASFDSLESKYARLLSLSDLFSRLLAGRIIPSPPTHTNPAPFSTQKELARIMFEKNFISTLTSSIADIDLNFPNSKRAVKYILRPLKTLTEIAIDLSQNSDLSTTPGQTEDDEISTASSVTDQDDNREETPDLFRNSTLGILDPGREEESSSDSSDDDEGMYDDEYDEGMEYDEELDRDGDEVISDDDEEVGDEEAIEGLPGDVGMDVEVVIDGEDDDDATDEEDSDDSDDDMDDGEVEIIDEITGEDNDSLDGGNEEDWQDEDDGGEGYPEDEGLAHDADDIHDGHDHNHEPSMEEARDLLIDLQNAGAPPPPGIFDLEMDVENDRYITDLDLARDEEGGDEDEDEDDLDDEEMAYEPDYDDEGDDLQDPPPWGWDDGNDPIGHPRHHHPHAHIRRIASPWTMFPPGNDRGMIIPPYRSHRPPTSGRGGDDGMNPLLRRSDSSAPSRRDHSSPNERNTPFTDWVHMIHARDRHDGGAVSIINSMMTAMGATGPFQGTHGGALHVQIGGGNQTILPFPRDIQQILAGRPPVDPPRPFREEPSLLPAFNPIATARRWQEEAVMLFGGNNYIEKTQRIVNALLKLLVPPALEEEKIRKQKEAEAAEERRRKEEEETKAKEEEERLEKEIAEREAQEQREREEREAAERALVEQVAENVEEQAGDGDAMEGVEATGPEALEAEAPAPVEGPGSVEAGPSTEPERVRATFRGREVDITGLGIDLEYLNALPDELREDVLMQQLAEQRSQAAVAGEPPTEISREFLDALPSDIREEILQQEAQDRRRRERDEARRQAAASGTVPQARAEDMDPASFLASLDPVLRSAVLSEQDDDVLAQLPAAIAAEARALGADRITPRWGEMPRLHRSNAQRLHRDEPAEASSKKPRRQIVQMLDKAGVATLLRLLFISQQGTSREALDSILENISQNRQNRVEVLSLLLSILHDGSVDVNAIEKSFVYLSLRAKQSASQKTPQPLRRASTSPVASLLSSDMTPLMVIQQCLSALVNLTRNNFHVPSFFLSEHEMPTALRNKSTKKGKSKENRASKFALNALLSLLDRKMIMDSAGCMEQLSSLLQSITQPLTMLHRKDKDKPAEDAPTNTETGLTAQGEQPPSATDSSGQATTGQSEAMELSTSPADPESAPPNLAEGDVATAATEAATEARSAEKASSSKTTDEQQTRKQRALIPPFIPEENLRLVVSILAARECSAKTFRDTVSTINNLSAIPGAKEVFGKELIKHAQDLGDTISRDLDSLIPQILSADPTADVQGAPAMSKFAHPSADQAKLLRVLTALDYLFDPKRAARSSAEAGSSKEDTPREEVLTTLYENSTFGPLWSKLSECLSSIRQRKDMLNVASILLPLIEALMMVCKNTTLKDSSKISKEFAVTSPAPESLMENLFFRFTEDHRKILNDLVRNNPRLMSGTFSLLVKNPKVLEFDNKRNYFTRRLHSRNEARQAQPSLQLSVRRDQVFMDSFRSLYFKSPEEMKFGKLSIRFHGEEGVDAGGVTREWFQVMSRQMFNPDYVLFIPVASDRTTFHPNKLSQVNSDHLMFFKFIGRVIGKALYESRALDCHFSRAVYKRILGKPVSIKDMETLDLDYYKSLLWTLENDISDIITETFSIETEVFGVNEVVDLVENGRNIPVTEENKQEYVQLVVEYRLTGSVKDQLAEFLKGFHDIVPAELISIFNEQELELLISGLPDIDVDDWKNNTEYHNYSASSPQIQWFWRAVRSFDKEERAKLLQFVTGTSKVPLNGFKELEGMNGFSHFNIHRDYGHKDRLPSSHTCFNQLDLPEYESYEALRQQVYTAMTAGSEYFGFA